MKWIIPIMGFRENAGQVTGIERIWSDVRKLASDKLTVATPYEWWEDTRAMVDLILRNSDGQRADVMVIAYSWGCGWAFQRFAKEAELVGLRIRIAVLCDPVYRSGFFPPWLPLNPLSISRVIRRPITIPASVDRVEWVRQAVDWPRGAELIAEDPLTTSIGHGRYLKCGHTLIDDSREFQNLAIMSAHSFANQSPASSDLARHQNLDQSPGRSASTADARPFSNE